MNNSSRTYRRALPKTGRNETCPCGSEKKFKKCCIDKHAQAERAARNLTRGARRSRA